MLRYAVRKAPEGAAIVFDPALNGKTIELDAGSPANHIRIDHDLTIQGPGSALLTISGGGKTRIFFITGRAVRISGVTLANGLGKGGDGGAGLGSAGGGGGAAGMGGAIFLGGGWLTLRDVALTGNRAAGGSGGSGGSAFGPGNGGGGGGFGGGGAAGANGGTGGELAANGRDGLGGDGGTAGASPGPGLNAGWSAGGGGGAFVMAGETGTGGPGGSGGFGGGNGGSGGLFEPNGVSAGGRPGFGGSGFGGAIFVSSGLLELFDSAFVNNTSTGGSSAASSGNGIAKGGALFICSAALCGPGHQGAAILSGNTSFQRSAAADAGVDQFCTGRDDTDICGEAVGPSRASFLPAPQVVQNPGCRLSLFEDPLCKMRFERPSLSPSSPLR